jgi:hypothetical protein
MSLNIKKIPSNGGGNRVEQPAIDPGSYPARVVQIIDLGVQTRPAFKGDEKPPAHMISITYELLDEFCVDAAGEPDESKPRWVSEDFPLNSMDMDLATSTKRYKALDPTDMYDGDFTLLIGSPCVVQLVVKAGTGKNAGKVYTNVMGVAAMRPKDADKAAELVNPPKVFTLDEPDMQVFASLPEWMQEKLKSNLKYKGSALEAAILGKPAPEKVEEEDEPAGADAEAW